MSGARHAIRQRRLHACREAPDRRAGDLFSAPAEMIDRWVAANQRSVDRVEGIFADIRNGGVFDLTTLSVALRQLRNVVLTSGPTTRG